MSRKKTQRTLGLPNANPNPNPKPDLLKGNKKRGLEERLDDP